MGIDQGRSGSPPCSTGWEREPVSGPWRGLSLGVCWAAPEGLGRAKRVSHAVAVRLDTQKTKRPAAWWRLTGEAGGSVCVCVCV